MRGGNKIRNIAHAMGDYSEKGNWNCSFVVDTNTEKKTIKDNKIVHYKSGQL